MKCMMIRNQIGGRMTRQRQQDVDSPDSPSTCSPVAFESTFKRDGKCLSDKDIRLIAGELNISTRDGDSDDADVVTTTARISKVLGPDMSRWVDSKIVRKNPILKAKLSRKFRPKSPKSWRKKPRMWLSSIDIDNVMKQYTSVHEDFIFLGVFPRNFTEVVTSGSTTCLAGEKVCNLNVDKLISSGKMHIGVVFNLDRHDRRGSHWVACFISLDASKPLYGAYYYDSVARPPPFEAAKWMLEIQEKVKALGTAANQQFKIEYNVRRRQFHNTECGMFSIYFLTVAMKNDTTFDEICNDMGTDDDMFALRRVMFRQ